MKIFLTGGSGEIGRPALAALVEAGHSVRVATRSAQSDRIVASAGARPVRVDLFDARAVRTGVADASAIVHLATAIPPSARMADPDQWAANDRLRLETTAHLVDAGLANGTARLVLQSYFAVQGPRGDEWIETEPNVPAPPWSGIGVMDTMRAAEQTAARFASGGGTPVVLRFGSLYSETSEQLQAQVGFLEGGLAGIPGSGRNYWPYVASEDAGRAVAKAIDAPEGTYNVADDEPVTLERFWTMAAEAVGTAALERADVDGPMADILLGSWRVSNRVFCEAAGWRPEIPSVLDGWPRAAAHYRAMRPGLRPNPQALRPPQPGNDLAVQPPSTSSTEPLQ
jgi:nucleoside-diphosphate-sugar epimerase